MRQPPLVPRGFSRNLWHKSQNADVCPEHRSVATDRKYRDSLEDSPSIPNAKGTTRKDKKRECGSSVGDHSPKSPKSSTCKRVQLTSGAARSSYRSLLLRERRRDARTVTLCRNGWVSPPWDCDCFLPARESGPRRRRPRCMRTFIRSRNVRSGDIFPSTDWPRR